MYVFTFQKVDKVIFNSALKKLSAERTPYPLVAVVMTDEVEQELAFLVAGLDDNPLEEFRDKDDDNSLLLYMLFLQLQNYKNKILAITVR